MRPLVVAALLLILAGPAAAEIELTATNPSAPITAYQTTPVSVTATMACADLLLDHDGEVQFNVGPAPGETYAYYYYGLDGGPLTFSVLDCDAQEQTVSATGAYSLGVDTRAPANTDLTVSLIAYNTADGTQLAGTPATITYRVAPYATASSGYLDPVKNSTASDGSFMVTLRGSYGVNLDGVFTFAITTNVGTLCPIAPVPAQPTDPSPYFEQQLRLIPPKPWTQKMQIDIVPKFAATGGSAAPVPNAWSETWDTARYGQSNVGNITDAKESAAVAKAGCGASNPGLNSVSTTGTASSTADPGSDGKDKGSKGSPAASPMLVATGVLAIALVLRRRLA